LYNKNTQEIDKSLLQKNINNRTKVLALTYVSNVLGTINPVAEIIKLAKEINPSIITVVDAAQAAPHMPIDIQELGCDFLVFSSHKMLGPTGVGVLWGKYDLLTQMKPYQYGGEMIDKVSLDETTFKAPPHKFEAGTPNIAGVIAHKEAINYLLDIGMENIRSHEKKIMRYAVQSLKESFGEEIKIYGPNSCDDRGGVISFSLCDYHPHDVAHILDEQSICIRAGNHCAQPLHDYLGANSTSRASFYIYNDERDVDLLVNGLKKVKEVLK
jgi:cysteine desulfurase/selenocysteine lyase